MPVGPLLSRRATLALGTAGGAIALAACDGPGDDDRPGRRKDPDVDLVAAVVTQIRTALDLAVAARMPAVAALHRQHLATLDASPPSGTPSPSSSPSETPSSSPSGSPSGSPSPTPPPRPSRATVLRAEQRLVGSLTDAAVRAESGQLARVLAAMAAAVGQRAAVASRGKEAS